MAIILVAEDHPADRELLSKLLGHRGHSVLEASDGAEALEVAQREHPQLIISDVLMPTMDGFEFVRNLRTIEGFCDTPVILYTANYHQREALAMAKKCGAVELLIKPSEPEEILAKVDAILSAEPPAPLVVPLPDPDMDAFNREHALLLTTKLAKKVDDLEAMERRLSVVVGICQHFATERNPLAILRHACKSARELTFAHHAVVGLLSADGSMVDLLLTSGFDSHAAETMQSTAPLDELLRMVVTSRTPVRKHNVDGQPEALGRSPGEPEVRSFLAVPIATPSRVYGWLSVRNKLGADEFSEADEEVTLTIAANAAIQYENARMVDDLQAHARAVLRSEERTHFALGVARMGLWELDLVGDGITWSKTMAPVFGLTPEQAPTTREEFLSLIHPADRQSVEESVAQAMRAGPNYEVEFRAIWPDGSEHWVAGQARLLSDSEGRPLHLLGIGMDINDRKSLEAQFRQAQKMEAVGQLAGGVAHDFNNLLTAIIGYTNFVLGTLAPEDSRRSDLEEVLRAGERGAALTRQLLAFSRKQVLQPTTVDLNALLTGMRQMLKRTLGDNVNLVVSLDPDLGAVRADPGQLEQVLMNLVVNAKFAMPAGGRLSVETANVELDDSYVMKHAPVRPGSYVMLAVSDSGAGMGEETKRRLFEPFYTTKEHGQGTGLGLATVYGIVKQSGGYIWVYSELGKGATFKVYLPRTDRDETITKIVARDGTIARGSETVLVVEDEDAVRFLTRVILERAGYTVFDAPNAQQAEELFAMNVDLFDLLVSDVIMPGASGPELFELLSRRRPDLKVLYVSGYTDDTIVHHGQLLPGVEFLQKPFTADALTRKVREALDR